MCIYETNNSTVKFNKGNQSYKSNYKIRCCTHLISIVHKIIKNYNSHALRLLKIANAHGLKCWVVQDSALKFLIPVNYLDPILMAAIFLMAPKSNNVMCWHLKCFNTLRHSSKHFEKNLTNDILINVWRLPWLLYFYNFLLQKSNSIVHPIVNPVMTGPKPG